MSSPQKNKIRQDWKKNYPRDLSWKREASQRIVAHIIASQEFKQAERIALYSPLPWEIDVTSLWQARPSGFAFPKVTKNNLDFFCIHSLLNLKSGFAGILEPEEGQNTLVCEWKQTDLFLIPGYRFDLQGTRIGSGKGFYDRYFSTLKAQPIRWGVCFHTQIAKESLPREVHDVQMNAVCSEKGITVIGK